MTQLNGKDFRARVRLSTKDDVTLALVGETCERVPPSSLPALLASRKIEPVTVLIETTPLGEPEPMVVDAPSVTALEPIATEDEAS